jgi:hypothetical protein
MDIALLIAALAVGAGLLIVVYRQRVRKHLPWFAFYVLWECFVTLAQLVLWPINRQLYNEVYWWVEAVEIALTVAVVRESFLRIFHGFTRKPGFRISVWIVIGAVVLYSAWKSVLAPPLESSRLDAFVFGAEFLVRWGIVGIALLTTILGLFTKEGITREDAVMVGFGVMSVAYVLYVSSFSLFGNKHIFLTKYIPSVGYFLAAFWWIYVFSRPVRQFGFEELGMGPEDIGKVLKRYRNSGERL